MRPLALTLIAILAVVLGVGLFLVPDACAIALMATLGVPAGLAGLWVALA